MSRIVFTVIDEYYKFAYYRYCIIISSIIVIVTIKL